MCDSKKLLGGLSGWFATPSYSKAAPAYAASAATALDITLPDIVTIITLVYTLVLLIGALPNLWRTIDFFRNRHHHDTDKSPE